VKTCICLCKLHSGAMFACFCNKKSTCRAATRPRHVLRSHHASPGVEAPAGASPKRKCLTRLMLSWRRVPTDAANTARAPLPLLHGRLRQHGPRLRLARPAARAPPSSRQQRSHKRAACATSCDVLAGAGGAPRRAADARRRVVAAGRCAGRCLRRRQREAERRGAGPLGGRLPPRRRQRQRVRPLFAGRDAGCAARCAPARAGAASARARAAPTYISQPSQRASWRH